MMLVIIYIRRLAGCEPVKLEISELGLFITWKLLKLKSSLQKKSRVQEENRPQFRNSAIPTTVGNKIPKF